MLAEAAAEEIEKKEPGFAEGATPEGLLVGKKFYESKTVNEGHYSKKRDGVADVDPKVRKNL